MMMLIPKKNYVYSGLFAGVMQINMLSGCQKVLHQEMFSTQGEESESSDLENSVCGYIDVQSRTASSALEVEGSMLWSNSCKKTSMGGRYRPPERLLEKTKLHELLYTSLK